MLLNSTVIHYELDRKYTSACGKVGVGEFTTDIEKITCRACKRFVHSKTNRGLIEERERKKHNI